MLEGLDMSFAVVAFDPEAYSWGVGVASKFLAVGSVVPWASKGVGAIATQALANYSYGPEGLELLREHSARETIEILTERDDLSRKRLLGIVDSKGNAHSFTGLECLPYAGSLVGENFAVQGNILTGEEVLESMSSAMESSGTLKERIIGALVEGDKAGGDRRGRQSAAILIVGSEEEFEPGSGKICDIRVEDHTDPLNELIRIDRIWSALFGKDELIYIEPIKEKVDKAVSALGYDSLEKWAFANNFDYGFTNTKIGKKVYRILLEQASMDPD